MAGRLRFVSIFILAFSAILLAVSFATSDRGGPTCFGNDLGADYAGFYTAGWILNHKSAPDLYDREIQDRLHHELHPRRRVQESLPFHHPPFVAVALRPLAWLPYTWSFAVWLLISLGLYVTGLYVVLRSTTLSSVDRVTAFLAALSFEPFVMECWQGGQLSAVGFCSIAVAAALDLSARRFASGLVLGICLYKPTLLVVIIPVLVVVRSWRTLFGILVTGAVLALVTLAAVGWEGSAACVDKLLAYSRDVTESTAAFLRIWKYVDLNAFTRLLVGPGLLQKLLLLGLALPVLAGLLLRARRSNREDGRYRRLIWAAALAGTPLLNVYVPMYDSVVVAIGGLLAVDALTGAGQVVTRPLQWWLGAVYLSAWITQPVARQFHIQVFTLALLGLTVWICVRGFRRDEGAPDCRSPVVT